MVVVGYAAWQYLLPDGSLTGEMSIERLAAFHFTDVVIDEAVTGLSHTKYRQLARELEADPLGLNTTMTRLTLSSRKERLYLGIGDGVQAGIYRVDPRKRPGLLEWIAEHTAVLNAPREAAIDKDMPKFIAGVIAARDEGGAESIIGYRDTALYGYLTGPFGFHVVAVANGQAYRCVFEDSDGRLYFLLPGETREFELRGRPVGNDKPIFPGKILCEVARAKPKRTVSEPAESSEKASSSSAPDGAEPPASEESSPAVDKTGSDPEMVGDDPLPSTEGDSPSTPAGDPAMKDGGDEDTSPGMKPGMKKAASGKAANKPAMMKDGSDSADDEEPKMDGEKMPAPKKPARKTAA